MVGVQLRFTHPRRRAKNLEKKLIITRPLERSSCAPPRSGGVRRPGGRRRRRPEAGDPPEGGPGARRAPKGPIWALYIGPEGQIWPISAKIAPILANSAKSTEGGTQRVHVRLPKPRRF